MPLREVFADTTYWIALLHSQEQLHARAIEVSQGLQPFCTVTSEMVLTEVLADFSKRGEHLRSGACSLVKGVMSDSNVELIPQSSELFKRAIDAYCAYRDKQWSLTDCASFIIMRERDISQALTADHDFVQAGFEALLAGDSA